jgi:hypothetical protein
MEGRRAVMAQDIIKTSRFQWNEEKCVVGVDALKIGRLGKQGFITCNKYLIIVSNLIPKQPLIFTFR